MAVLASAFVAPLLVAAVARIGLQALVAVGAFLAAVFWVVMTAGAITSDERKEFTNLQYALIWGVVAVVVFAMWFLGAMVATVFRARRDG